MTVLIGEIAALGSALIWAVAARIYEQMGQRISPLLLNFSKGAIALGEVAPIDWTKKERSKALDYCTTYW